MSGPRHSGMRRAGMKKPHGSTIMEAITVLLLVGIITRIAIPQMQEIPTRARATEVRATFSVVAGAANRLSLENLPWPPDADAGVMPPNSGISFPTDSRSTMTVTKWTGIIGSFPKGCRVTPRCRG